MSSFSLSFIPSSSLYLFDIPLFSLHSIFSHRCFNLPILYIHFSKLCPPTQQNLILHPPSHTHTPILQLSPSLSFFNISTTATTIHPTSVNNIDIQPVAGLRHQNPLPSGTSGGCGVLPASVFSSHTGSSYWVFR